MKYLEELLTTASQELFGLSLKPAVSRPEPQFGDYASNLALQIAQQAKQPPRQVAEKLQAYLTAQHDGTLAKVEVAGPGFLNFYVSDRALWSAARAKPAMVYQNRAVLLEYSCPNAFKELHTGHLYQTIIGDTIGRLLTAAGAKVFRANFGGDVGLHVAKCLWGAVQALGGETPSGLAKVPLDNRATWLSRAYVAGSTAYEDDPAAAQAIKALNKQIYEFHQKDDHDTPLAQIYWECRGWSYDYFKKFYDDLQVQAFDKYYPESSVTPKGLAVVKAHIPGVFEESQHAVVYKGETGGTHTRVFITSQGLPTYETKDLGVIFTEFDDFTYDQRLLITGNDQSDYMKVVFAALAEIDGDLGDKQQHLTHGTIRFGDGQKMSSRLGNVTRAVDVLTAVHQVVKADSAALQQDITLGAVKYAFLKPRIGGDIAFDVGESVSLQGNSGPYLQYAHARARSILAKASAGGDTEPAFEADERLLVRQLSLYPEVIEQATAEFSPHLITTYLYELAQVFNRFYENNRVIGDAREHLRLNLVQAYADTLKAGLALLNIPAPHKM